MEPFVWIHSTAILCQQEISNVNPWKNIVPDTFPTNYPSKNLVQDDIQTCEKVIVILYQPTTSQPVVVAGYFPLMN
jgi:hypothetical protein